MLLVVRNDRAVRVETKSSASNMQKGHATNEKSILMAQGNPVKLNTAKDQFGEDRPIV